MTLSRDDGARPSSDRFPSPHWGEAFPPLTLRPRSSLGPSENPSSIGIRAFDTTGASPPPWAKGRFIEEAAGDSAVGCTPGSSALEGPAEPPRTRPPAPPSPPPGSPALPAARLAALSSARPAARLARPPGLRDPGRLRCSEGGERGSPRLRAGRCDPGGKALGVRHFGCLCRSFQLPREPPTETREGGGGGGGGVK